MSGVLITLPRYKLVDAVYLVCSSTPIIGTEGRPFTSMLRAHHPDGIVTYADLSIKVFEVTMGVEPIPRDCVSDASVTPNYFKLVPREGLEPPLVSLWLRAN